jgi:hypothetical protein
MAIVSQLMSIHASTRHLDRAIEVNIVIAEVISKSLHIVLSNLCRIVSYLIVNWQGSCNCGLMRNKEEVKENISLGLNKTSVNSSSWSWIKVPMSIVLLKESMRNPFVYKSVQNFWVIALGIGLQGCDDLPHLNIEYFVVH